MKKLVLIVMAALLSTGCWAEVRNGNEVWGCENRSTQQGNPFVACMDSGWRCPDTLCPYVKTWTARR